MSQFKDLKIWEMPFCSCSMSSSMYMMCSSQDGSSIIMVKVEMHRGIKNRGWDLQTANRPDKME